MPEEELRERLERIIELLQRLMNHTPRAAYKVNEAAESLSLSPWYVRQLCRSGELLAERIDGGAGGKGEYRVTHDELERYRLEGKRRPLKEKNA